jgi:hypothetical protein
MIPGARHFAKDLRALMSQLQPGTSTDAPEVFETALQFFLTDAHV